MRTRRQRWTQGAVRAALAGGSVLIASCATGGDAWIDHAALILQPSRHELSLGYNFGADPAPEPAAASARRSVVGSIAAAASREEAPLPGLDSMDWKGGRLYLHTPKKR